MYIAFFIAAAIFGLVAASMAITGTQKLRKETVPKDKAKEEITGGVFGGGIMVAALIGAGFYFKPDAASVAEAEHAAIEQSAAEEREENIAAEACRSSASCWGEQHLVEATLRCRAEIPRLAAYTSRWTDGLLEFKFPLVRWHSRDDGILIYSGDKIEFQNGFGAWQNMVYECVFDTNTGYAIDVRAEPGRI